MTENNDTLSSAIIYAIDKRVAAALKEVDRKIAAAQEQNVRDARAER